VACYSFTVKMESAVDVTPAQTLGRSGELTIGSLVQSIGSLTLIIRSLIVIL